MTKRNNIKIILMGPQHVAQAAQVVARAFMREPMTRTLNLTYEQVLNDFSKPVEKLASEGLSYVAVDEDSGHVIGACINKDYTVTPVEDDDGYSDSLPIFTLVDELDEAASELAGAEKDDIFHLYILAVDSDYAGQGVGKDLALQTCELAKAKGFKRICSEVTGPISQHITLNTAGFEEIARVNYHDFVYQGKKVFEAIPKTEVEGCLMVYRML